MRPLKWIYDDRAKKSYNVFCAFEGMLINIKLIHLRDQTGVIEAGAYGIKWESKQKLKEGLNGIIEGRPT